MPIIPVSPEHKEIHSAINDLDSQIFIIETTIENLEGMLKCE